MSGFFRAGATERLARWREVIFASGIAALGLYWGLTAFGALQTLGWVLAVGGAAGSFAALQSVRFRRGGGGLGVVQIDEARVTYMGPFGGSTVDLGSLRRLDIDREARPAHWWLLTDAGPDAAVGGLAIPVDAEGADALFELFAALPGLSSGRLIAAMERGGGGRETVWRRTGSASDERAATRRLTRH